MWEDLFREANRASPPREVDQWARLEASQPSRADDLLRAVSQAAPDERLSPPERPAAVSAWSLLGAFFRRIGTAAFRFAFPVSHAGLGAVAGKRETGKEK